MKKAIVFICFLAGASCFISAGLYINRQNAGLESYEEQTIKVKNPELLSEINMTQYVSLPASFADFDITEDLDDIKVTENNVEDIMYEQLMSTAKQLTYVSGDNETIVANYTVSQKDGKQEVKSNVKFGYSSSSTNYNDAVYDALNNAEVGTTVHAENASFFGYENATVDITVVRIYDMPYPVTDDYIKDNTEYKNVYDMKAALMNDSSGEAKRMAREHTISTLIDTMMSQTTFIKLPESLINKELEALQKEDPNATLEDARHGLYKIFFIAAVINDYDVATKTDMEKRYDKLDNSEKSELTPYEIERKKYLLFEDDVVTCIYKKVQVNSQVTEG